MNCIQAHFYFLEMYSSKRKYDLQDVIGKPMFHFRLLITFTFECSDNILHMDKSTKFSDLRSRRIPNFADLFASPSTGSFSVLSTGLEFKISDDAQRSHMISCHL